MLSKIFLKVSKAGNTYGNIQEREEAHSQTCQFGMTLLYNVERKGEKMFHILQKWQYKKVEIFSIILTIYLLSTGIC